MTFFHFKLRLFLVQYRTNKSRCLPEVCACPVSRPRNRLVVQSCQDDARSSSRLWPFNKFMGRYFVQYFMQGSLSPLSHFDPSCHLFGGGEQRAESREQRAESREQRAESREQRAESREQRAESRESSRCFETGVKTSLAPPPASIRNVVSAGATALLGGQDLHLP